MGQPSDKPSASTSSDALLPGTEWARGQAGRRAGEQWVLRVQSNQRDQGGLANGRGLGWAGLGWAGAGAGYCAEEQGGRVWRGERERRDLSRGKKRQSRAEQSRAEQSRVWGRVSSSGVQCLQSAGWDQKRGLMWVGMGVVVDAIM